VSEREREGERKAEREGERKGQSVHVCERERKLYVYNAYIYIHTFMQIQAQMKKMIFFLHSTGHVSNEDIYFISNIHFVSILGSSSIHGILCLFTYLFDLKF